MRSDVRIKLQERQAAMRDKAVGIGPPAAPLPILWANQIDRAVMSTLKNIDGLSPLVESALAWALPGAIRHLEGVITSEGTSVDQRTQASIALFFLMNVLQRADIRRRSLAMRTEEARKKRVRAEEKKARVVFATAEIPLIIDKKRRAFDKAIRKAAQEQKVETVPESTKGEL